MIPLLYRLRKEIRVRNGADSCLIISELPLNVIRVSPRAASILLLCDGNRTLMEIADETGVPEEEQVFRICEYFRKKGMLEIEPAGENCTLPVVTVIIPTKDRKSELAECLESIFSQGYPKEKIEVIVVDDGSQDGTGDLVGMFPCKLLSNKKSRGQSYCRNLGAKEATGEILAFIDSDCVAGKTWLRELVPYFQWDRVGAVGGFVDGYFRKSTLDRYEMACSPLNMGNHILIGTNDDSTFYTPTCNLLIRRKAYIETGGITESLHVGEDVDFCWRIRRKGYDMFYLPFGAIRHKHRNHLGRMMKRRADYGTSEALLYTLHKEKKKVVQLPTLAAVSFLALCLSILFLSPAFLFPAAICPLFEAGMKIRRIHKLNIHISPWKVALSILRSYFSFFYFISFHAVRYYMSLFLAAGIYFHPLWYICTFMLIFTSSIDYSVKSPYLTYPLFLTYYAIEHISYQVGVFAGCIQQNAFGSYRPRFIGRALKTR